MKRTARFITLAGLSAGLVFSTCGCRGSSGTPQNESQQPQIKLKPYVVMATVEHPAAMPDADREDAIVVTVLRDGAVFLGSDRIDISSLSQRVSSLSQRVHDLLAGSEYKEVYIRADARARFRVVEDVIDSLRSAGVGEVGLLVRRKNADAPQGNTEPPKFLTGLDLLVLTRSLMKEHFSTGILKSVDRVNILRGPTGPPAYKINQTDVQKAELLPKLTEMYKNRAEPVLFIRGDDELDFASVVEVVDIAKDAGVDHIAILTPQVLAVH